MLTLINRTLITSASALSVLGLVLAMPQSATAQDMGEIVETEATETEMVEMEASETVEIEDGRVGQAFEMDDSDIDTDADVDMDSDDIDADYDYDDDNDIDTDTYSAPTYSNSPRALW